jgi:hypothetical protein
VTNDKASLTDIGDRGIIIPGDPRDEGWKYLALNRVVNVLKKLEKPTCVEDNYAWVSRLSLTEVVHNFVKIFIE